MSTLPVHCSFEGCTWTGLFKEFEVFDDSLFILQFIELINLFIPWHII